MRWESARKDKTGNPPQTMKSALSGVTVPKKENRGLGARRRGTGKNRGTGR